MEGLNWLAQDCKSPNFGFRRFESARPHHLIDKFRISLLVRTEYSALSRSSKFPLLNAILLCSEGLEAFSMEAGFGFMNFFEIASDVGDLLFIQSKLMLSG
jgi:hypothetical protein